MTFINDALLKSFNQFNDNSINQAKIFFQDILIQL